MSVVSSTTLAFSWGPSPVTATIALPGDHVSEYPTDSAIVVTVDSVTWSGIVRAAPKRVQGHGGWSTVIDAVDNRVKWSRAQVYCLFNQPDVRDDNLATPGIDRQRRYKCIVPDGWRTQTAVWHDAPLTARQVLTYLCEDVGGWDFEDHDGLDKPLGVFDANNGMDFSEALGRIAEECGLLVGLKDAETIQFVVKGSGTVPSFPSTSGTRETGSQLSANPTNWKIVGDRSRYQVNNIALEPGWNPWWDDYVMKADFWDLIDTWFGPFDDDDAGQAARSAKALSATLREFAEAIEDDTILDPRSWGDVSRNDIPAFVYVQDIVYKAYQIPADFEIEPLWLASSLTLDSLEMSDGGLNVNVDFDVDTGEMTVPAAPDRRMFPNASAFVIVKGLDMSAFDPMARKHLNAAQMSESATKWRAVYDFNLDVRVDGRCVIFSSQIFTSSNLVSYPNHGVLSAEHPLYDVAVVNPAPTITPADVRASLMFLGERYSSSYGSGSRHGVKYYSGLSEMWVFDDTGIAGIEVPCGKDDSGEDVFPDDLAAGYGAKLLLMPSVYTGGSWSRAGVGTALSGVVADVKIKVTRDAGTVEEVTFADDRVVGGAFPSRFLDWNRRSRDLFPKQEEMRQRAWLAKTLASMKTSQRKFSPDVTSVQDLSSMPLGNADSAPVFVRLPDVPAGTAVFTTDGGIPSTTGEAFAGVVINQSNGYGALATQGIVPVKITGPFKAGESVSVDGDGVCKAGADGKIVGRVLENYTGTSSILAPVQLCGFTVPGKVRHPWQAIVTESLESSVKVKVWQRSTLLQKVSWTDKAVITGFGIEHELTTYNHLRLTVRFDLYGTFESAELAVSTDDIDIWTADDSTDENDFSGTWVQVIAQLVAAAEGEDGDAKIGSTDFVVYCPTTTHLVADWMCISGKQQPALLPWYGGL